VRNNFTAPQQLENTVNPLGQAFKTGFTPQAHPLCSVGACEEEIHSGTYTVPPYAGSLLRDCERVTAVLCRGIGHCLRLVTVPFLPRTHIGRSRARGSSAYAARR